MNRGHSGHAGGFSLLELLITLATLAMLLALLAAVAADARRNAGLGHSMSNLKRFGAATFAYAADNEDAYPTFWWSRDHGHSDFADLESQRLQGGMESASAQAVDIIRRRGVDPNMPVVNHWLPHVGYSHLVLMDYLDQDLPREWAVSPGDEARLDWLGGGDPPGDPPLDRRWVYSSSYETPPTFYAPEGDIASSRIVQGATHALWQIPGNAELAPRALSTVAFPTQKLMMYEKVSRYFGPREAYFMYPEARVPALVADGAVTSVTTSDTNEGWLPSHPTHPRPTHLRYEPREWEPPTLSGEAADIVIGHYRWTRGGALGRDFGGEEIDTGQR